VALSAVLAGSGGLAWVGGTGAAALGSTGNVDAVGAGCGDASDCDARSMPAQAVVSSTPTTAPIRAEAVNAAAARPIFDQWVLLGKRAGLRTGWVEFIQAGEGSCLAMDRRTSQSGRNSVQ
jgi:hypothetical protein